jgi:hypothetical protein
MSSYKTAGNILGLLLLCSLELVLFAEWNLKVVVVATDSNQPVTSIATSASSVVVMISTIFVGSAWFSQYTATVSLSSINWLGFVAEK